jgi:Tfp pilus assembly protein PilO
MSRRDFKLQRRAILAGLGLLLVADVALAVYSWNQSSAPGMQAELDRLSRNREFYRADIKRAQDIREKIPAIQKDCDKFEQSMFPVTSGYSSVSAELSELANKSGLRLEDTTFHQAEVQGRDLNAVEIAITVSGGYSGVVRFLNALQRSDNVYAVDGLSAKPESTLGKAVGEVRVQMRLRTYFRTA